MKAAIMHAFAADLSIETVAEPECPRDGVIVDVQACGVCRSDHHTWIGADANLPLPHVMGHEFAGYIVEVGPECRRFHVGDRVTAPFILGCGACADCTAGQPTVCDRQRLIGFTQWGAFAERVAVQTADFNLVQLPDSIGFAAAAGMGCRVTTAWRGLRDRAALQPGEWVAIHGCGGVGLSAVMLASAMSAQIVAIDISDDALDIAKQFGASVCISASAIKDIPMAIHEATGGGAHVSIDALGITATFENSLRSLRKLGRHVQIGMPVGAHATVPLPLLDLLYARQLTLHGMRGLGAAGFAELLEMADAGKLDLSSLVSGRVALSHVGDVLAKMGRDQLAGITVVDNFSE